MKQWQFLVTMGLQPPSEGIRDILLLPPTGCEDDCCDGAGQPPQEPENCGQEKRTDSPVQHCYRRKKDAEESAPHAHEDSSSTVVPLASALARVVRLSRTLVLKRLRDFCLAAMVFAAGFCFCRT